jgi:signal transduction histidine kinase
MAGGHKVRMKAPSDSPDGSHDVTEREELTTLGFGQVPAVAMLGAGGAALRRRGGLWWLRHWRLRDWRLRTKLTAVLLVPLMLAGVLGALRVTGLVHRAHDFAALGRQIAFAQQLGLVMYALQGERHLVAAALVTDRAADRAALQTQLQRVDSAVVTLSSADSGAEEFPAAAGGQWAQAHRDAMNRLAGLPALRQANQHQPTLGQPTLGRPALGHPPLGADASPGSAAARTAVTAYSGLIAVLLDLDRRVLQSGSEAVDRRADGVKALAIAEELASWQHAMLLTGILSGSLTAEQQLMLRTADARFDAAADEFAQATSPGQRQLYFATRAVVDRKRLLDAVLDRAARGAPLDTVPGDWNSAAAGTIEAIHQGETALLNQLRTDTGTRSDQARHEAFWDGAAITALLLLAVLLLMIVVRSLLQPLRTLRTAAFEVADHRLPEVVEQLRSTDGAPRPRTVDPVPVHSTEEVGQVARAFDTVHVQAVRLASEQAQLRSSLNDVFLHLSGRSEGLLEQQLQVINELRSTVHEPELVNNLRQLDHLAARMRRYSENLVVLAGGTVRRGIPGPDVAGSGVIRSGADGPVALLDVLTDAVSEIEHYERVVVRPAPAAMVAGPVARDLTHLIAELLDNAISVAPQGTTVTLDSALTEDKSLLVEVTDCGAGLPPDELQAINARLATAPAADASISGQIGLFVVRGLAAHHGITVRLRQRFGSSGLTASVLLPPSLVTVDLRVSTDGPVVGATALPLQVSVVDEATAADLFSPASFSPPSAGVAASEGSRARTAQEEWLELFGPDKPQGGRDSLLNQLAGAGDQPQAAAADPLGAPGVLDASVQLDSSVPVGEAPVPGQPQEVREEIFDLVSAWFSEQQSALETNQQSSAAPDWRSPFDAGWQAAQALHSSVDHELTTAGLPRREPRAHLVTGADGRAQPTPVPGGLARTPDTVRGRLSRYQRGLRVGRHARITGDDIGPDDVDQRVFEENQQ